MAELPATWIEKLLEVTSAFSRARTAREVGEVAVLVGEKALGATTEERRRLARVPTSNPNPSCIVARSGRSEFIESQEEFEARYGELAQRLRGTGGSRAALALHSGDRPVGCLALRLPAWRPI